MERLREWGSDSFNCLGPGLHDLVSVSTRACIWLNVSTLTSEGRGACTVTTPSSSLS